MELQSLYARLNSRVEEIFGKSLVAIWIEDIKTLFYLVLTIIFLGSILFALF